MVCLLVYPAILRLEQFVVHAFSSLAAIFCYHEDVNNTHQKTLSAIFSNPIPKTLEWRRVEGLLMALGCELIEGDGSRVAFRKGAERADFHRPHPGKEAKPYQVRAVREYLERIGVKP